MKKEFRHKIETLFLCNRDPELFSSAKVGVTL